MNHLVSHYRGLLSIELWKKKILYGQQSNAVNELFMHTLLKQLINAYVFYYFIFLGCFQFSLIKLQHV